MKQLNQWRQMTGRQKILIYITCGIVGVFLMERFFFTSLRSKAKELNRQIKAEEANLKIGLEIQKRKERATKDYQDYRSFLSATEKSEKELFTGFLREIENLAQKSGLSILNLTPKNEPQNLKDYKKYTAELRAEASLENFIKFLEDLQNNSLLIKLDKLALTPKDEQGNILKLDATVSISIP